MCFDFLCSKVTVIIIVIIITIMMMMMIVIIVIVIIIIVIIINLIYMHKIFTLVVSSHCCTKSQSTYKHIVYTCMDIHETIIFTHI